MKSFSHLFRSFLILQITGLLVGALLRLWLATWGNNTDMLSYEIVGKLVLDGQNVYATTARYNYGPIWFCLLGAWQWIAQGTLYPLMSLHILIVAWLTLCDLLIFFLLKKILPNRPHVAWIFFLNPISIMITGYHSQFDNFAISMLLLGFYLAYIAKIKKIGNYTIQNTEVLYAVFLGISLMVKHVFIFYPFWLVLQKNTMRQKAIFFLIPFSIFLFSFLPFVRYGYDGIIQNVFLYKSFSNSPFWFFLAPTFAREFSMFATFIVMIVASGFMLRHCQGMTSICSYLVCLTIFSSGMANQYLAVPLLGVAYFFNPFFFLYTLAASGILLIHKEALNLVWMIPFVPKRISPLEDLYRCYDIPILLLCLGFIWACWCKVERFFSESSLKSKPLDAHTP